MNVFLTGSTGYVGSSVLRALRRDPSIEVRGLVAEPHRAGALTALGGEPVVGTLSDLDLLAREAARAEVVFHLAASDAPAFLDVDEPATAVMLEALGAGRALVRQGGSVVFGPTSRTPSRPTRFAPPPPLARRAKLDERILASAARGVRPFVVYGSFVVGGRGAVLPNALVAGALALGRAAYPGSGEQIWSTVTVDDLADLIVRAGRSDLRGGAALFAAAGATTMKAAATAVATVLPVTAPAPIDDAEAVKLWGPFGAAFAMDQNFDGALERDRLGWSPRVPDLRAARAEAASFMQPRAHVAATP